MARATEAAGGSDYLSGDGAGVRKGLQADCTGSRVSQ